MSDFVWRLRYNLSYEPPHDKTNTVCLAKTQISLGIRPVCSESSLSAWRKLRSLATHWAHSEDSDQTGRMWVFAGRTCHFVGFVMRRLINYYHSRAISQNSTYNTHRLYTGIVQNCNGHTEDRPLSPCSWNCPGSPSHYGKARPTCPFACAGILEWRLKLEKNRTKMNCLSRKGAVIVEGLVLLILRICCLNKWRILLRRI